MDHNMSMSQLESKKIYTRLSKDGGMGVQQLEMFMLEMAMSGEVEVGDDKLTEFMERLDLRDNKISLINKLQKIKD